jgi:GntR family transcriptional regulator
MSYEIVQPLKTKRDSLSTQTQQYLLELVEGGTYQPGDRLPSESDLAAQLGISRSTLREALLNLEQEGIIIRRHGVGTFIAPGYEHQLDSGLERLESILELAARQGLRLRFDALEVREEPADQEMVDALQVIPSTPLTHVSRAIVVDTTPVAYMVDVVPASVLAQADVDNTFNGSVLDLLRQQADLHLAQAMANIIALTADASLAEKLAIEPGQAVLLIEELLFDDAGTPVEYSRNYFIPEFFRFHVVRR